LSYTSGHEILDQYVYIFGMAMGAMFLELCQRRQHLASRRLRDCPTPFKGDNVCLIDQYRRQGYSFVGFDG
jgi:hypothetical protein